MPLTEKIYSIDEVVPAAEEKPVCYIQVCGEKVLEVNPDCAWDVDRVFVDYTVGDAPHEVLVVVFKRKEET